MNVIGRELCNYISAHEGTCWHNNNMANLIDGSAIDTRIEVSIVLIKLRNFQQTSGIWRAATSVTAMHTRVCFYTYLLVCLLVWTDHLS